MLFNSYEFVLVFLPALLVGFFTLSKLHFYQAATAWLTVGSLAFYSYWDIRYLPLLICSILFNYFIGSAIEKHRTKPLITFGVTANLLVLGYFKYAGFFVSSVNGVAGTSFLVPNIILPLGISFFTFTQIAYLVDAYRGETTGYSLLTYSLFVTFFPHLIAGPILYHKSIIPQFCDLKNFVFSNSNFGMGLAIFAVGLFKKVMIADNIAPWVNAVFTHPGNATFIEAWVGALGYTLQLYFDFSGYSEMAIGLGLMVNINLPTNFNSPYHALSIIDFWRRWHMTLSQFLKNYLYIPLGGNRLGETRRYINLLVTMLLGGLWHGAGWTFVVWGGLHGIYLTINHAWQRLNIKMPKPLAWSITFFCVVVAWVVFRAHTLNDAYLILKAMAGLDGITIPYRLKELAPAIFGKSLFIPGEFKVVLDNKRMLVFIPILVGVCVFSPSAEYIVKNYLRPNYKWAFAVGIIFLTCLLNFTNVTEFLYFQF